MPNSLKENAELMARLVAEGKLVRVPSVPPPILPPIPPAEPALNPFSRGPLPASTLLDTDIARQFHATAIPQSRILPLSDVVSARAGAQAASQFTFIQQGGGGLLLEVNNQRNPNQGVLNLTAGTGVQLSSDAFGRVTINAGDGLVHGDTIWDYDSAYTILRDDFIAGNATSGTIGDLGWIFGAGGTAVLASQKADAFPYLGQFQFGPNAATTNTGGGIVLPAANLGINSTGENSMWPLLDYPGWKCTWVFTLRRPLTASPTSTPFDAAKLSVYVGLGNLGSNASTFFTRPPGFIGVRYDTDPASFALTSVATASGGNSVYTASASTLVTNQLAGFSVVISGFTTGANNGTFTVVSNTINTITVNNAVGVSETHAATAVCAALALSDSTYVLEACFNSMNNVGSARMNDQGTNGGTHNTGVAVVENAYHRVEISCLTAGQAIVSFDGAATTFTVTKSSSLRNSGVVVSVGDGFSTFGGTPSLFTKSNGYTGAGPGTVFTVSGLSAGLAVDNGTYINAGVFNPDALTVQQTLTSGVPSSYTVTNYPALAPMAWITNDSSAAGSSNNANRSLAVDFFSFVWNKGLAGATPSSSNPRYW